LRITNHRMLTNTIDKPSYYCMILSISALVSRRGSFRHEAINEITVHSMKSGTAVACDRD
jgi:hypothetical protein